MSDHTLILPPDAEKHAHDQAYRLTMMVPRRRFFSYLRDRWWLVLACLVVSVGSVLTYETVRPDTYTSIAQLLIGDVQVNMANLFTEDPLNYFGTQIELLKSPRLLGAAMQKATPAAGLKEDEEPVKVTVVRPQGTSMLHLQAVGSDPQSTRAFLQALIDEYLLFKKETRASTSEDLVLSLNEQLGKRESALKAEQDKWVDYQRTNNLAVLAEEGRSAGLYLAELNLQLAKLRLERELLLTTNAPAALASETATNLSSAPLGLTNTGGLNYRNNDVTLKSARLELALRRAERDKTQAERGEVAARRLKDEVERLEKTLALLLEEHWMEQQADLVELDRRIAATREAIPAWEAKVREMNERLSQGERLKNNIQREQGYYDHLLGMFQTVDLSRNVQQERISILQSPTPAQPATRGLVIRVIVATVAGLTLSLVLVFFWHLLDDRFASLRDLQDQYGEEILGLVPRVRIAASRPREALLGESDTREAYLESFRHLRSALVLSSPAERRARTVLITGVSSGEGKTTIAANLGRTLARSGLRVILVDADLRHSGLERLLGGEDRPGILDYLRGEATASELLQPTEVPGLGYVRAGRQATEGEGWFLQDRLRGLLQELQDQSDYVILDGAPILEADEVGWLVPHAECVAVVVRPFHTRSRQLRQALGMLYQRKARQVTLVFNQAGLDDLGTRYRRNGRPSGGRERSRPARAPTPAQPPGSSPGEPKSS